ncbi:integrin alpha-8-like [Centruroides sculpturatus]|uniref:integrin alpha-8-like n=1 Tax=Centruroides sculpturatus TaxID=218467 RepID=UPI000C6D3ED5|nr:integrin alpha-8-like [Centruroides sculpturatus]
MEDKNVQKIESEITLLENTENCKMQMVYLMDDIQDLITPIKFQLTYNLKEPEVPQFCKSCPVIDATATNTITKEVMFWNGCGDDNECLSDLKLSVKYLSKVERFVIGENNILEMEVKAENLGEPAYNSTIFIKLPEDVMMINQAECTSTSEDQNAENYTLLCNVGNPLTSDSPNIFQLKMDTSRLSKPVDKLVFEFWIETASKEINPSDNFYTVTIPVIFAADIQIRGFAENELIFLQEDNKEVIPISHTYFVSKQLRNPIPVVDVTLKIPIKLTVDGPDFLELTSLQIGNDTANNVPSTCDVVTEKLVKPEIILSRLHRDVSSKRYTHQEHADHSNFDTINLDCTTAVCISISCRAGPFVDTKKIAKFQISGYINLTNLQSSIGEKDVTVLISEGKVTIKDANYGKFVREDRATVATSLEKYGLHQQKIPIWIIIVSVVVGLLLLIVLLSLLYKSGFFRRKEQEEMEKLKNEEENEETLALNGNST